ncbi:LLM class flavin-dependent oxidoreductase [Herbiconiux daphne]|uniref:LLM class flavin-dependent oxidoreductase n=1 Tax=Herbiconiux daphne TaxID=2970914 RepID=A0ABT2H6S4_9MICO|nr:LLM class flavin-dependent oxidoreductase [Herbiconiux daphne]MCS5735661.1 LLM class flavin-dependent oxidoreductase [Herbiconiux daphne]
MTDRTQPLLAVEIGGLGASAEAWRWAPHPRAAFSAATLRQRLDWAVAAGADAVLIAEDARLDEPAGPLGALDPVLLASLALASPSAPVVIPEIDLAGREPFHVAKRLATLDHIGQGRTGWQVTAASPQDGNAADALDVIEVVRRLWDSWEDGAEIRDHETHRFLDRTRLHRVDFTGQNFSIAGPLTVSRPPQGQLPLVLVVRSIEQLKFEAQPAVVRIQSSTAADAISIADEVRRISDENGTPTPEIWVDTVVALDEAGTSRDSLLATVSSGIRPAIPVAGPLAKLADLLRDLTALIGANGIVLRPATADVDLRLLGEASTNTAPTPNVREADLSFSSHSTFTELLGLHRQPSRYGS